MMKLNSLLLATFLFVGTLAIAQKQEIVFDVVFRDKKVGVLHAQETRSESKSFKVLRVETKSTILFIPIHMESEVSTTQENGILIQGTAYRNSSRKSSDVVATVTQIESGQYQRERNGVIDKIKNEGITFCVVDLYFQEPIGVIQVFSNMYAQMLKLERIDIGKYQLTTPDKHNSLYTYRNGKLISIEVDTIVGKVLSKRI